MMISPIMIANLLLVAGIFLVLPVWLLCRLKQPNWIKWLIGFDYFALLCSLYLLFGALSSLENARRVARDNIATLTAALKERPETLPPILERWLNHDEGEYFLLRRELPGTDNAKNHR